MSTATRECAPVERLAYTVPEAAEALGISTSTMWRRVWDGGIESVKIGNSVRIPAHALQALVTNAAQSVSK